MGGNQKVTESLAHLWYKAGFDRERLLLYQRRRRNALLSAIWVNRVVSIFSMLSYLQGHIMQAYSIIDLTQQHYSVLIHPGSSKSRDKRVTIPKVCLAFLIVVCSFTFLYVDSVNRNITERVDCWNPNPTNVHQDDNLLRWFWRMVASLRVEIGNNINSLIEE